MDMGEVIESVVDTLNEHQGDINGEWYAVETPLTEPAKEDGKLRRVEFWLLTPEAAEDAGLTES